VSTMWTSGQTVLDRYRLVERLGIGLGGETWVAEGPAGEVAVKLIRGEDARGFADLIREASLLRDLRHPNVVSYREFSDRPDEDCAILVTDLVPGGDLGEWRLLAGPPGQAGVAALGLQLVAALEALEAAGILHRDLKPANVLVETGPGGAVTLKVADFGISRRTRGGVSRTTDLSLTPEYAAPEQFTGGTLSRAADLYALGGVLGFIASGRHPAGAVRTGHEALDGLIAALRQPAPGARPTLPRARAALEAIAASRGYRASALTEEAGGVAAAASAPPGASDRQTLAASSGSSTPTWSPDSAAHPPRQLRRLGVALLGAAAIAAGLVGWAQRGDAPPAGQPPAAAAPAAAAPDAGSEVPAAGEPDPGGGAGEEAAEITEAAPIADQAPGGGAVDGAVDGPADGAAEGTVGGTVEAVAGGAGEGAQGAAAGVGGAAATLMVNSRPWSWVVVDGARLGRTTDVGARFPMSSGPHRVRLETDDGLSWEREVSVEGELRLCINLRTGTELGC
jgi:hypothetical protein